MRTTKVTWTVPDPKKELYEVTMVTEYRVVNRLTRELQSSWRTHKDAREAAKSLNRYFKKLRGE